MIQEKEYPQAIKELIEFRDSIIRYFKIRSNVNYDDPYSHVSTKVEDELNQLRQDINQKTPLIKYYFEEINLSTVLHGRAPAVIGGFPYATDVLDNLFDVKNPLNVDKNKVVDMLNQCIGKYQFMVKSKKSIIDIEGASILKVITSIEQNLRKCFKKKPSTEIEVQDEVEKILNVQQVKFNRETESFHYSSKSYKPDFVLENFDAIIEIKFCNDKADEKKIIAEINDDIQAYLTKYKLIIFIVYDINVIRDVDLFRKDLTRNPKVLMYVIKH